MNYYVLPGTGIFGGIKVGFQFCEILASLGVRIVAVTPDGTAPKWFTTSVPVIPNERMKRNISSKDTILFSLPHDYEALRTMPARLLFHCQGTDKLILPIISDPKITLLSCWPQAHAFMERMSGRRPIDVGISIANSFFYDGRPKSETTVLFMPRRGANIAADCLARSPHLSFQAVDNKIEPDCAGLMKKSGYFLATAAGEGFGLPALEAMAAGSLVVSVPVVGGSNYLVPGKNCILEEADGIAGALQTVSTHSNRHRRTSLRQHAVEIAHSYRAAKHRKHVAALLPKGFSETLSWV